MVFSSITFIFFLLPVFLILDMFVKVSTINVRNFVMLSVSLLFYLWGEATNIYILVGLGLINYLGGKYLYQQKNSQKLIVGLLIVANISVLSLFKFFSHKIGMTLPLGISFFTFHGVSYLIDIYRKTIQPARSALDFMTYFCMFPHLVAGPIVRFSHVQDELISRGSDKDLLSFGVYRFLLGLNKKVLIANSVAPLADWVFTLPHDSLGTMGAWIGVIAYTLQIYFDFSAYSDMAIGLAAMAGFRFHENFDRPYSSYSIKEFWRRWHISLSSWFRDYLYIPLGGSRGGQAKTLFNLIFVFFLCGLWHGADNTFIMWGLWHGCFLLLERIKLSVIIDALPRPLARLYAIIVVMVGWVFFRLEHTRDIVYFIKTLFIPKFIPIGINIFDVFSQACIAMIIGIVICVIPDRFIVTPTAETCKQFSMHQYLLHILLAVVSVAILLSGARNPFIYFNF